jgi:glycosyltransferase involved in cell wall biosynthesis
LERKVAAEGIPRVEFLGFIGRDRQADLWRRAAFSVVPSIWQDPLPTVAFEAWERGRPVVVSDSGGLADIVEDGRDGLKVPMADAPAWAAAISRLLADPTIRLDMAQSGREKLRNVYSRETWLNKLDRVYESILPL